MANHKLLLLSILVKAYLYNCIFSIVVPSIHVIWVLRFFHSNLTVDLNDMQLYRLCNKKVLGTLRVPVFIGVAGYNT